MRLWKTNKDKKIEALQRRIDELIGAKLYFSSTQHDVVKIGSSFAVASDVPMPAAGYIKQQLSRELAAVLAEHMKIDVDDEADKRVFRATISIVEE